VVLGVIKIWCSDRHAKGAPITNSFQVIWKLSYSSKGVIHLSILDLNNYLPLVDRMESRCEDGLYPIWLLVNPKHPSVRLDIWNPIFNEIQDKVYRELHARINAETILIKNVISDIQLVPNTLNWWEDEVVEEIEIFRKSVLEHQPIILMTVGSFPYEFVRRVFEIEPKKGPKYWSNANLEDEFEQSIANFNTKKTNRLPLLRRIITDNFNEYSSLEYKENYFRDVGIKIADRIVEYKDSLNIWIE
jgi:hypothetical protein